MILYFYRLGDYDTFKEALEAKATRNLFIDDAANPSLRAGAAGDAVDAIVEAVDLVGGAEPLQFVLTTDDNKILDIF
jgi:hypothetical protein